MTIKHHAPRLAERISARVARIAVRGQLGAVRETELARLSGARR